MYLTDRDCKDLKIDLDMVQLESGDAEDAQELMLESGQDDVDDNQDSNISRSLSETV